MNWLGLRAVALLGAILGGLLGGVAYAAALASGWDAPYLVGLAMGLGAMLGSPDRSGMRGLLIATAAIWVAAIVQTRIGPYASAGILGFHATLTAARVAAFAGCALTAFLLARTSARRNAPVRAAGS
ncbi:MAG TPA: hypothetical protein VLT33_19860 [Labilithrix sp.]|nr:hypothetical protein [Labilithrix sp.]